MTKILITGGATQNMIDATRCISSKANGNTALAFFEALNTSSRTPILLISKTALRESDIVIHPSAKQIFSFDSNTNLQSLIELNLKLHDIEWMIHSASVSDYIPETIIQEKISSSEQELVLKLVKAPKIVDSIKTISPSTKLISFKAGSPETSWKQLYELAHAQLERTKSEIVWANILENKKEVMLVHKDKIEFFHTREQAQKYITDLIKNKLK